MIRNAIKQIVRGWKKSLLFWMLTVMIALFFISGSVLAAVLWRYQAETYASYRTIGLFEYVGDAYPDETVYSEHVKAAAQELDALAFADDPRVLSRDAPQKAVAYHEAITRRDTSIPYYENAVLLIKTGASKGDPWYTYATVERELYSVRNAQGKRIKLNTSSIALEPLHYYLVHGYYTVEGTPLMILNVHSYQNAAAASCEFDGDIERMLLDVTTEDGGYSIPEGNALSAIAETYRVLNDGLTLIRTADVQSLLPFEQETLYLREGRFFTQEEQDVCIVTEWIADRLGVGVGDRVSFSIVSEADRPYSQCYWSEKGFDIQETFTVVGITNANNDDLHCVFAPKQSDMPNRGNFSYTLGIARLDNDGADAFYAEVVPKLPENVRLLIYDQGYYAVSEPLKTLRKAAVWLSVLDFASMLALALVFGFLFVYGDRKSAQMMTRLGAGIRRVYGHYLICAGLIALSAAALSTALSSVILPKLVSRFDAALTSTTVNHTLDYSNAALSFARSRKPLRLQSVWLLPVGGGIAVLLSLISCTIFTRIAITKPIQRRETVRHRTHKGNSRLLHKSAFRYAMLSALRGGARSILPIAAVALGAAMLCGLVAARDSYTEQLHAIRANTKIKGVYTDLSGRRTDGLVIEAHLVNALYRTGLVEDVSVSMQQPAFVVGRITERDGREEIESVAGFVATPQSLEAYTDLLVGDRIVFTDNLLRHPIFGSSTPKVRWLDVYNELAFRQTQKETVVKTVSIGASIGPKGGDTDVATFKQEEVVAPIVVPERFLTQRGYSLGDIIQIQLQNRIDSQMELMKYRIVGSYHSEGSVNRLFCPLVYALSPDLLYSADADANEALYPYTLENAQFTLKRSEDLPVLKAYLLESGYSEVRRIRSERTFVVLYDGSFLYTTAQLEKRIATLPSFFPLPIGIAIAVAYVLVFLRRKEVILMQLLGARRIRAWLSLWLEQLLLCLVGVGLALFGFCLIRRTLPFEGLRLTAFLALGYLCSAAICAALLCFPNRFSQHQEV